MYHSNGHYGVMFKKVTSKKIDISQASFMNVMHNVGIVAFNLILSHVILCCMISVYLIVSCPVLSDL